MSANMRLLCLAVACAAAEASVLKETHRISQAPAPLVALSPGWKPESSEKFFKKNYPVDKKPKVDVLHFKHPYPVVQDTDDFDKDFVKDENSDNGEWKAQTEYDRLRHKVAELRKQAAKALEKKLEEEKELKKTKAEYQKDMAKEKDEIAKKKSEVVDPMPDFKPAQPEKPTPAVVKVTTTTEAPKAAKKESIWSSWWPFKSWGTAEAPKPTTTEAPRPTTTRATTTTEAPTPEPIDTRAAAEAVEKAMKNFKECQKELAEAKEALKKLMAELEKAKMQQAEAHEKVNQALQKLKEAEANEKKLHDIYTKEHAEYAAAQAAYVKQKAKVDKLTADLKAAAAKVKAIRDAEDKDGGVYPVHKDKSMASSMSTSQVFILATAIAIGRQLA